MKVRFLLPLLALAVLATGCSTWDGMSKREKSVAIGAGVGGLAGAVITNGGILGTVGGAAIGGVIGEQTARR